MFAPRSHRSFFSIPVRAHGQRHYCPGRAVKHAYLDELAEFAGRGQSLIVYHHADRTTTVSQQAIRRLADLAAEVAAEPIAAVRASRGTVRLFLIAAVPGSHSEYLRARLRGLESSPWRDELLIYWPDLAS